MHHKGHLLDQIEPVVVAAYIEQHSGAKPRVKQHLAALRRLFDLLVIGQIIRHNPATAVRGPSYTVRRGKTPVPQSRGSPTTPGLDRHVDRDQLARSSYDRRHAVFFRARFGGRRYADRRLLSRAEARLYDRTDDEITLDEIEKITLLLLGNRPIYLTKWTISRGLSPSRMF